MAKEETKTQDNGFGGFDFGTMQLYSKDAKSILKALDMAGVDYDLGQAGELLKFQLITTIGNLPAEQKQKVTTFASIDFSTMNPMMIQMIQSGKFDLSNPMSLMMLSGGKMDMNAIMQMQMMGGMGGGNAAGGGMGNMMQMMMMQKMFQGGGMGGMFGGPAAAPAKL